MPYTKRQKRVLRQILAIAHERELSAALDQLAGKFHQWATGKLDCFQLSDLIHRYHNGAARWIYSKYDSGLDLVLQVAACMRDGLVESGEIPEEFKERIQTAIDMLWK